MRRTASATLAILLLLSLTGPATAVAGGGQAITADLEGVSIEIAAIPLSFCHDRAFPQIHCFATAQGLERNLTALDALDAAVGASAASSSDYVQVYAGTGGAGPSMTLAQNYDTLVVVGWNDRIRSYRGLNGARGVFWTDWFATGDDLAFCCNVLDPSLPAAFDLKITSVYRR